MGWSPWAEVRLRTGSCLYILSPHSTPQTPHPPWLQDSWFPSAQPGPVGSWSGKSGGARSLDRFMFWLRLLLWPHAECPVLLLPGSWETLSQGSGDQGITPSPPQSWAISAQGVPENHAWTLVPPLPLPQPCSFKSSLVPPLPGSPLGTSPSMGRGCLGWLQRLGQRSGPKTLDSQPSPFKTQDSWFFTCLASVSCFGKGQWAGAEGLK